MLELAADATDPEEIADFMDLYADFTEEAQSIKEDIDKAQVELVKLEQELCDLTLDYSNNC